MQCGQLPCHVCFCGQLFVWLMYFAIFYNAMWTVTLSRLFLQTKNWLSFKLGIKTGFDSQCNGSFKPNRTANDYISMNHIK